MKMSWKIKSMCCLKNAKEVDREKTAKDSSLSIIELSIDEDIMKDQIYGCKNAKLNLCKMDIFFNLMNVR